MICDGVQSPCLVESPDQSHVSLEAVEPSECLTERLYSDWRVENRLQHELCMSGYPELRELRCRVTNGVATLSGSVGSYHAKQMAQTIMLQAGLAERIENMCCVRSRSNVLFGVEATENRVPINDGLVVDSSLSMNSSMKENAMLVLTRHVGEKIYIGDDVVLSIVRVQGGRVKIGIEAPTDIPINRHEILNGGENQPFPQLTAPVSPSVAG